MDLLELWEQMGIPVKSLMILLGLMSMWSMGVFFERLFTFTQAGKQSKAFAPQVAKHLKDGHLKDAIAVSQSKNYKYSHLGKVVLAGLQEYQFQKDAGVELSRDDVIDSVRRAIQRASALTAADLKKGMGSLATIGAPPCSSVCSRPPWASSSVPGIAATGSGGLGAVSAGGGSAVGTAIGLFVAIPAVWFYNGLHAHRVLQRRDGRSRELVDYFIKRPTRKSLEGEPGRAAARRALHPMTPERTEETHPWVCKRRKIRCDELGDPSRRDT